MDKGQLTMKKYQLSTINCQLKKLPKYGSYKDSGIEWLGEIPSEWSILPGMKILRERSEKNKGMIESRVLSLSYGNIIVKPEEKLVGLVPESFETYQIVDPDDIIVRCTDLQNDQTSLRTGLAKDRGIITSAYLNLQPRSGQSSRFLHYYLHALDLTKVLYKFGSGLRQNLSFNDFKHLPIPFMPYEKQKAIANFLDEKTAQIDEAIGIKEQQIALLKERKQIIIQNAVTKGLNLNAPMKDSGVDWIGDIPSHWDVKRLKFIGNAIIGLTYDPSNLCDEENGTLVLRASNLKDGEFVYGDKLNAYVNVKVSDKLTIKKDDILICSRNGSRDLIGKCAIAAEHDAGVTFGAFTTVFRSEINPYLIQILNSEIFRFLSGSFLTSTINQLTIGNLNSISVPLPPEKEQQQIRKSLEEERGLIDTAISAQQAQIDKLKEYKASLINSAVTGKIKIN